MTTTNDLPSLAEVLARAYAIVATPCSAAESERAKVLLGIAKEMREEAQYRRVAERRLVAAGLRPAVPLDYGQRMEDDPEATQIRPATIAVDPTVARLAREQPTLIHEWSKGIVAQALGEADFATQQIPAVREWQVGDRAECRHCHTPIEAVAGEPIQGRPGLKQWLHRYTQQAVCVDPSFATGRDGAIVHTFAEPSV